MKKHGLLSFGKRRTKTSTVSYNFLPTNQALSFWGWNTACIASNFEAIELDKSVYPPVRCLQKIFTCKYGGVVTVGVNHHLELSKIFEAITDL